MDLKNVVYITRAFQSLDSKDLLWYIQGRQLVPKSGRSERGGERIFRLFLPLRGAFCFVFSGQGRKSGSAYALVDLVTLAPLLILLLYFLYVGWQILKYFAGTIHQANINLFFLKSQFSLGCCWIFYVFLREFKIEFTFYHRYIVHIRYSI